MVNNLINSIDDKIRHVTADSAYDTNPTYKKLTKQFPFADIVIPPQKGAAYNKENEFFRNRNILEIKYHGHMEWQKRRVSMASVIIIIFIKNKKVFKN